MVRRTYFIKTFGCQMNKADSERIAAALEKRGYKPAKRVDKADLVVINSCSVRQSAEDRILGLSRNLFLSRKKTGRPKKIILTGCALYHGAAWLKKKFKYIDEFIPILELAPIRISPKRKRGTHAWVPIVDGCSHFCTYCVVPYARGPERSRPLEEIVCKVEELARQRHTHITLLGQNVNSYGKDIKNAKIKVQNVKLQLKIQNFQKKFKIPFALLLAVLHEIPGIQKISFITSNPWDLTDDIIEAMKLPKIDRYLHLPVQSGDDKILRRMNRPYTAKEYIELVKKIRRKIPDIKIGTDIIVGFPGETKRAFQNTVALCQKIGFEKAYIAIYSPRPGTAAYKLSDNVSYEEKKRRWRILDKLINKKVKV